MRKKDRRKCFDRSKVRMLLTCNNYGSHRCECSKTMTRKKEGPTEMNLQKIQQWTERGYICVGKFPGNILYVQRKCVCGDCIESQYDNHLGEKKGESGKGGRLVTESICATYYIFDNVLSEDDIKRVEILEEKIR